MNPTLLLVSLFANGALAGPLKTTKLGTPGTLILYSCMDAVALYSWGYVAPEEGSYYNNYCQYPPELGSLALCAANYYGAYSSNFNDTMSTMSSVCIEYGDSVASESFYYQAYVNATANIVSTDGLNLTETIFYAPVSIPSEDVTLSYKYYENAYYNWDMPSMFAGIFYCYFIFVFMILAVFNFLKHSGKHGMLNNKWINWYRKHISVPALFNDMHTNPHVFFKVFSTLVPTRVESVIIFFFICLNVLLTSVHYNVITVEEPRNLVLNELLADRTGLLSFGLIPLLIIFSGRNNILIKITGLPYSSFIMFHKWVSRLMFLHALIHSLCWTVYAVDLQYLTVYEEDGYWVWGVVATTIAGILCLQAFHMFRRMSYEVFLTIHIVLACLFIVGCWYHCYDLGYLEWLYASWAVWIADRLVRVIRISAYGVKTAEVEHVSDGIFKITVEKGKFFNCKPGSFAYVYFMTPYGFWQSHPFTVIDGALNPNEITMYIQAKKGFTRYIKNKCVKAGGKTSIKIAVEGPYGHHAPMQKYDTALLLAGGNGIPGPYYHARDLVNRDSKPQVKLVWAIRNPNALCWFFDELKALSLTRVQTDIYITGTVAKDSNSEKEKHASSSDLDTAVPDYHRCIEELSSHITFHYKRPSIKELVVDEFSQQDQGTVAVMSCGPPPMVDEIRKVFGENLDKCSKRVDLFEELQAW